MRQRRPLRIRPRSKERLEAISNAGLTIPLQQILENTDNVVLEIGFHPLRRIEYWLMASSIADMKTATLTEKRFYIVHDAKLIVNNHGKPVHSQKMLKENGIKIVHRPRGRWG